MIQSFPLITLRVLTNKFDNNKLTEITTKLINNIYTNKMIVIIQ